MACSCAEPLPVRSMASINSTPPTLAKSSSTPFSIQVGYPYTRTVRCAEPRGVSFSADASARADDVAVSCAEVAPSEGDILGSALDEGVESVERLGRRFRADAESAPEEVPKNEG